MAKSSGAVGEMSPDAPPPRDHTGGSQGGVMASAGADSQGQFTRGGQGPCKSCGRPANLRTYWNGERICGPCAQDLSVQFDQAGWPEPWWELPVPDHVLVMGAGGTWWRNGQVGRFPSSLAELAGICERRGITQVWVHQSALRELGWPESLPSYERDQEYRHPFTEDRGNWTATRPWLQEWCHWWRRAGAGFDLHVPVWGRSPWRDVPNAPQLAAAVGMYEVATGGAMPWAGTGAITSDRFLRRHVRELRTTYPGPTLQAREAPVISRRVPGPAEAQRWCHALDLNLAYCAPASSLRFPTGEPRHVDWCTYQRQAAAVYLVERPGHPPRWVTGPTMERWASAGAEAQEAWIWDEGGRHLYRWYEVLRDGRQGLLGIGGAPLAAVKDICREGLGRLASRSRSRENDPLFQPYWAWAVIAELRERLLSRVRELPLEPVAIDTDCLYVLSDNPSAAAVATLLRLPVGDGLGQFKAAGSCEGREAVSILRGHKRTAQAMSALREAVAW